MSENTNHRIPPELQEQFAHESQSEREALEQVWHLLGRIKPQIPPAQDSDVVWSALKEHIEDGAGAPARVVRRAEDRRAVRNPSRSRRPARTLLAAAAFVALLLAGALVFWNQPVVVTALPGERITVALPDGSSIELSGGSSIHFQRNFGRFQFIPAGHRTVTVEGEAFFDVEPGNHPFVVETFNARIEVIGTQFEVQAWSEMDHPETRVTLASGRLEVKSKSLADSVITLGSIGHMSRIVGSATGPTQPQEADLNQLLAWRQHGFYASDQPLSTILARLEHRFGVDISLSSGTVGGDAMTLHYPQQVDVETILRDICVAKGLKYRPTSRGFEIVDEVPANGRDHA